MVLLGVLEAAGFLSRLKGFRRLPSLTPAHRTLILALGSGAAVVAVVLGLLLSSGGDYEVHALSHHRNLGYVAAGAALLAFCVRKRPALYAPVLVSSLLLLAAAGHAGGSITHGSDFLTARMPPALARLLGVTLPPPQQKPSAPSFSQAQLFSDGIQPILRDRCVSCHGSEKSNGGLRLDSWAELVKGGKHGGVLKPGDPQGGLLARRIDLPLEEKEHMPPRGKPQLTDEELTVLEWWAGSGQAPDARVASIDLPPAVDEVLKRRLGETATVAPPDRAATLAEAARVSARLGVLIRSVSADGPWLDVTASHAGRGFGDAELAALAGLAPAIQWLDLGGTSVTDEGMKIVGSMANLERLHLDGTKVTDEGLAPVGGLKHLQYLNLRGTAVTDQGLSHLRGLPRLRSLYVWQTAVTRAAVEALAKEVVDPRRTARWEAERAELEREIEADQFKGNLGESLRIETVQPEKSPNPTPK
jgi:hypothetical protein